MDLQPTVFSPEATLVGSSNKDDFQKSSLAFSDCFFSSSFLRRRSASWRFFSCNSTIRGLAEGGSMEAAIEAAMEVAGWPPRDMSNCEWPNWRCIMDWGCGYGLGCTKEPKWEAACAAAACAACEGTRPGYTLKNEKNRVYVRFKWGLGSLDKLVNFFESYWYILFRKDYFSEVSSFII